MLLFQSAVLLCKASKRDDLLTIQILLQVFGPEILEVKLPNRYAGTAGTPFHFSVRHGNQAAVNLFLDQNPLLVNILDDDGNTPLHWAPLNKNNDPGGMAVLLLLRGANLLMPSYGKITPLQQAVRFRSVPIIKVLLQEFPDNNLLYTAEVKATIKFFNSLIAQRYWESAGLAAYAVADAEITQLLEDKLTMSMDFSELMSVAIAGAFNKSQYVLQDFKQALAAMDEKTPDAKKFFQLFFEALDPPLVRKAAELVPSALLYQLPAYLQPNSNKGDSKTSVESGAFTMVRNSPLLQVSPFEVVAKQVTELFTATEAKEKEVVASKLISLITALASRPQKGSSLPFLRLQLPSSFSAAPPSVDAATASTTASVVVVANNNGRTGPVLKPTR